MLLALLGYQTAEMPAKQVISYTLNSVYYVQHGDGRSFLWLEPRLTYYQFQATEKPKKANHSYTKV